MVEKAKKGWRVVEVEMNNGEWGLVGNKRGEHLMANTISTNTNESFYHVSLRRLMTNSRSCDLNVTNGPL